MREPDVLVADNAEGERGAVVGGFTFVADGQQFRVPATVVDIESFRQWTDTDDVPEKLKVWWLCGEVWIDMSHEQVFTHVLLKGEIFRVLGNLVEHGQLGLMLPDGGFLTNLAADISGKPDAMFISTAALASEQVRMVPGAERGIVEIEGTPDMVLEVVSDSSVNKDNVVLLEAYWNAGISEYWLVDAREDGVKFDIYRHGPKGYKRLPKKHGWMVSPVFRKSFRLVAGEGPVGQPKFTLDVR